MLDIPCVRCNTHFERPTHPMAHSSSICDKCKSISPETIYDQGEYNFRLVNVYKDKK